MIFAERLVSLIRSKSSCVVRVHSCALWVPVDCGHESRPVQRHHIPGFTGLQSGTQPPPGLYVGSLLWVYPTSTIKDSNGNSVTLPGSLTSTSPMILFNVVSNIRLLGGNVGASIAFPFIANRIQFNSLALRSGPAYTDRFVGEKLG